MVEASWEGGDDWLRGGGRGVGPQVVAHVLGFQPLQYNGWEGLGVHTLETVEEGWLGRGEPRLATEEQTGTLTTGIDQNVAWGVPSLPRLRHCAAGLPYQP